MYKIDLHTHSTASHDGGLSLEDYKSLLDNNKLNYIAITDHGAIDFALNLQKQLGDKVIVGQEIMTNAGEIIGLYLTSLIESYLTPLDTIAAIKEQGGLVYIPHPFESIRSGVHPATLDELIDHIDIIEVCNGRAFIQDFGSQAVVWARLNHIAQAASSDAHGPHGVGKTYTLVTQIPTKENLTELLQTGSRHTAPASLRALLYPKANKLKKKLASFSHDQAQKENNVS